MVTSANQGVRGITSDVINQLKRDLNNYKNNYTGDTNDQKYKDECARLESLINKAENISNIKDSDEQKQIILSIMMNVLKSSEKLLEDTLRGDAESVAKELDKAHSEVASILTYNDENSLGCAIGLAYYSARKDYKLIRS